MWDVRLMTYKFAIKGFLKSVLSPLIFKWLIDVIGEAVLPVIISFRNGGMKSDVMPSAAESQIPIIRIKVMFLSRNY